MTKIEITFYIDEEFDEPLEEIYDDIDLLIAVLTSNIKLEMEDLSILWEGKPYPLSASIRKANNPYRKKEEKEDD